jgi:hypothetical protein
MRDGNSGVTGEGKVAEVVGSKHIFYVLGLWDKSRCS